MALWLSTLQLAENPHGMRFPPTKKIILIDANSMFTHIPVLKTIDIIYEHLIKSGLSYDYVDEFEKLILVCVQHNVGRYSVLPT